MRSKKSVRKRIDVVRTKHVYNIKQRNRDIENAHAEMCIFE